MYRFLEHTADIFLEGSGKTFQEAFEEIALGMFSLMGGKEAAEKESRVIEVVAPTREELVVSLLSEILAECEADGFTPVRMKIERFDDVKNAVTARIYGEKKILKNIIKAVTYHRLEIKKEKNEWIIRVLFDI